MSDRDVVPNLWVVVPAFNEEAMIGSVIRDLLSVASNVVVVDDGSLDTTGKVASEAGATVLRHVINLGQGAALQTGIELAIARGADFICTYDGDGQHTPQSVERLSAAQIESGADVVLGSRFLDGCSQVPLHRRILLRAAIQLTRLQTRLPLSDTHNGLRLFTRAAASKIKIRQCGMAHASEILSEIARLQLRWVEVPTRVEYSQYSLNKGQSTLSSLRIVVDMISAAWGQHASL